MSEPKQNNEQRYFDVLKRITRYQTVDQLRRHAQEEWGVQFEEALGYAYENVIDEARRAVKDKRRPITEVGKSG